MCKDHYENYDYHQSYNDYVEECAYARVRPLPYSQYLEQLLGESFDEYEEYQQDCINRARDMNSEK